MPTKIKEPKEPKPPKEPKKNKKKEAHFCEIKYYLDYTPEEREKMFTVRFDL
jgi:hypothetical protein